MKQSAITLLNIFCYYNVVYSQSYDYGEDFKKFYGLYVLSKLHWVKPVFLDTIYLFFTKTPDKYICTCHIVSTFHSRRLFHEFQKKNT